MHMEQTVSSSQTAVTSVTAPGSHAAWGFAARILLGSVFVAVCAHIACPLPFTPVPFTLQPFAVLLVGMLFGPVTAFMTMALYLVEGASGLPVFTPAGLPGLARLVGPTGGYLFCYPVAAALAGSARLLRRPTFPAFLATGIAAMLVVYSCGALWFSYSLHVSRLSALSQTVVPFAAADFVKVCAAAAIAVSVRRHATAL